MRSPGELAAHIRQTRAFIDANHEVIVLIPRTETRTPAGGRTWVDGTPRAPQRLHFAERVSSARTDTRVPGGNMRTEEFTLIGYPDAVIGVNDRFDFAGGEYVVAGLEHFNGYEVRASVIRHGE